MQFLRQPHALTASWSAQLRQAVVFGLFVAAFLLLFQPFDLDELPRSRRSLVIGGYGLVTTVGMLLSFTGLWLALGRRFREERWTLAHELGWVLSNILVIALLNLLYSSWLGFFDVSVERLLFFLATTALIGAFPVTVLVLLRHNARLRAHVRQAAASQARLDHAAPPVALPLPEPPASLTFTAENGRDTLTVAATELLAVESADNYATVYWVREGQLRRELLRSSLTRLEEQLPPTAAVRRCHRSWLVNLARVRRVSGNAQGYRLHLPELPEPVPVSRKYAPDVLAQLPG